MSSKPEEEEDSASTSAGSSNPASSFFFLSPHSQWLTPMFISLLFLSICPTVFTFILSISSLKTTITGSSLSLSLFVSLSLSLSLFVSAILRQTRKLFQSLPTQFSNWGLFPSRSANQVWLWKLLWSLSSGVQMIYEKAPKIRSKRWAQHQRRLLAFASGMLLGRRMASIKVRWISSMASLTSNVLSLSLSLSHFLAPLSTNVLSLYLFRPHLFSYFSHEPL